MQIRILALSALLMFCGQPFAAEVKRWYSADQVNRGESLFRQNCAACHGQNAEATPDWKKTDADGNYPPPPLNGTAHTWHHDLDLLRQTIREGGAKWGGQMPPFGEVLNAEQIDAVIAYFQSKWPDDLYQRWATHFEVSTLPSLDDILAAEQDARTRLLRQRLGEGRIREVRETPIEGVWQVQIGEQFVYLLDDGNFVLMGDLVDLRDGNNLTEGARRAQVGE